MPFLKKHIYIRFTSNGREQDYTKKQFSEKVLFSLTQGRKKGGVGGGG